MFREPVLLLGMGSMKLCTNWQSLLKSSKTNENTNNYLSKLFKNPVFHVKSDLEDEYDWIVSVKDILYFEAMHKLAEFVK